MGESTNACATLRFDRRIRFVKGGVKTYQRGVDVQRLCQWLLCQANSYPVR